MLQYGRSSIASECIELFFSLDPPANQFLIRAHLCQALIAAPSNSSEEVSCVHTVCVHVFSSPQASAQLLSLARIVVPLISVFKHAKRHPIKRSLSGAVESLGGGGMNLQRLQKT